MKVLRWQEASLESSRGFYKGSRLSLKAPGTHTPKYMKIHENPWKSMKIYGNPWKSMIINRKRWKSSDDKKPAWNRAPDRRACETPCFKPPSNKAKKQSTPSSNPSKPSKPSNPRNPRNLWKSIENDESPQMTRSQPGIEKRAWPAELTKQSNFMHCFNQSGFPHLLSHRCCWIVRWCWLSCWEYWPTGRYAIPHCETVAFYWWHYPIVSQRQVFQESDQQSWPRKPMQTVSKHRFVECQMGRRQRR